MKKTPFFLCIVFDLHYLCIYMEINLLTTAEAEKLNELIDNAQQIVVTCHKSPDGDAMGASLAWTDYLSAQRDKKVTMVVLDAYPDFLHWLPGTERVVRYDKHKDQVAEIMTHADLIFCIDFNAMSRVDEMTTVLTEATGHKVMMDHHLNPEKEGMELMVSHPELSSASEVVFRVVWQLGGFDMMTRRCATQIYCGMMTDTGGFTYNSTRPEIYYIIGQLLTKGIDKDRIYRNVYNNYSCWAMRLRGYIISQKLNYFEDYHASYFTITRSDMARFHFIKGDAEGLVNEPLRIKGMKLSISLREDDRHDNLIWVSLRSVDDFPCNEMAARHFNGGGHLNASGGKLCCTMDEAEKAVREASIDFADKLK